MTKPRSVKATPHAGVVTLRVDGEEVNLAFTWGALSALRDGLGVEWQAKLRDAVMQHDTTVLAEILAAVSEHSADWWIEKSPPLVPVSEALQRGVEIAFLGPEEAKPADPPRGLLGRLRIS